VKYNWEKILKNKMPKRIRVRNMLNSHENSAAKVLKTGFILLFTYNERYY